MPRRPSVDDRLPELVDAAVRVFAEKGYRATQMADVAAVMGVKAGSLYNYVESKEGLFALCLEQLVKEGPPPDVDLPYVTPSLDVTLKRLHEQARDSLRLPVLSSALEREGRAVEAEEELAAVVTELYDLLSSTRQAADMIERSARDLPELASLYRKEWRAPLLTRLETYLGSRIDSSQLRRVDNLQAAARFVVETISWFARHRFHDPDAADLDDSTTKATVTELVVCAFVPWDNRDHSGSHR